MKEVDDIVLWLEQSGSARNIEGMSRFGINTDKTFGVAIPALRGKAKEYKHRHDIALELWQTGIHEARILAGIIADPKQMTPDGVDAWVHAFDSWDVCDQCCSNLLYKVSFVYDKIPVYAQSDEEFVRRTAFVLIAVLAVHDKSLADEGFLPYFKLIEKYATDERNFVRKAVNWALRQIGKRNLNLNGLAAGIAARLAGSDNRSVRWIGSDALRELTAEKTLAFIEAHRHKK